MFIWVDVCADMWRVVVEEWRWRDGHCKCLCVCGRGGKQVQCCSGEVAFFFDLSIWRTSSAYFPPASITHSRTHVNHPPFHK